MPALLLQIYWMIERNISSSTSHYIEITHTPALMTHSHILLTIYIPKFKKNIYKDFFLSISLPKMINVYKSKQQLPLSIQLFSILFKLRSPIKKIREKKRIEFEQQAKNNINLCGRQWSLKLQSRPESIDLKTANSPRVGWLRGRFWLQ